MGNRTFIFILISSFFIYSAKTQNSYKELALEAFSKENFTRALELIDSAMRQDTTDSELFYLKGYFAHHLIHSGRPTGKDKILWSDSMIIPNLEKALAMDPDMGNARYFLGVEYASRAWSVLINNDKVGFHKEYTLAYEKDAFPQWMLEEARNQLRSCTPEAILFISGEFYHNAITWLQIHENYRTDISVINISLLNRPWYIQACKNGIEGVFRSVPVSWTDIEIAEIRNYKWRPRQIAIPIPPQMNQEFGIQQSVMNWLLEPDLRSAAGRNMLSPMMAAFADIVQTNAWQRPIFLNITVTGMLNVDNYRRQHGAVVMLLPFETKKHDLEMDADFTHAFYFNDDHFTTAADLLQNNIPGATSVLFNHHIVLINLCRHYYERENFTLALNCLKRIEEIFPDHVLPLPDDFRIFINDLRKDIEEKM
jgi:tetratricopeptide (TPR) repeat protein